MTSSKVLLITVFALLASIAFTAGNLRKTTSDALDPITFTKCSKKDKAGDFCLEIYKPVCGYKPNVLCILPGCNYQTYANTCEACHDSDVASYKAGECPKIEVVAKAESKTETKGPIKNGDKTDAKPKPEIKPEIKPETQPQKPLQCKKADRLGDFCSKIHKPVCGYKPNVACIALVGVNCNYVTYTNACEACHDKDVQSYTQGECPKVEPVPEPEPEPVVETPLGTQCSKASRLGDACPAVYAPVCGYKPNVACIALVGVNCNYVTYGNSCEACHDADVESYTQGECPKVEPLPEPEPLPVESTQCSKDSRLGDSCIEIYKPVCGYKPNIMCIALAGVNCNYFTYGNSCEACHDADVESYTEGECPKVEPVPEPEPLPVESTQCSAESRLGDVCDDVYAPVCGYKPNIACIALVGVNCNYVTYGNSCQACHDADVESYTEGECPEVSTPDPLPEPITVEETKCAKDDRLGDFCPDVWAPVCGHKPDIMCITTPCNYITYGNSCEACHDADVVSYTQGECPTEKPKPIECVKSDVIYGCPDNVDPVCGYKPNIFCVTEPCNFITYFNSCEACSDPDVQNYTPGECIQGDVYY